MKLKRGLFLILGAGGSNHRVQGRRATRRAGRLFAGQGFRYNRQRLAAGGGGVHEGLSHVFVAVTGGGTGVGIASLINGTCDVATASREMKSKEMELAAKQGVYPKEFVVAHDGVAVIVNQGQPD